MKTNRPATLNLRRLGATKQKETPILKGKEGLCTKCRFTPISPYETELCDFCADELRFTVRLDPQF
jgi:hypothetical protein